MKSLLIAALLTLSVGTIEAQTFDRSWLNSSLQADTSKKSVKTRFAVPWFQDSIIIDHYSPAVRNRTIWGGLVPFDEVWASGAHMATSIQFPFDVIIGGKSVPKGKYAMFTIPAKDQDWTFILNSRWEQHLADEYQKSEDVVRVSVKPQELPSPVERLQWLIPPFKGAPQFIWLIWENKGIAIPVTAPHPFIPAK